MSFLEALNDAVTSVNGVINTYAWYLAFVFLIGIGLYFTIKSNGVQLNRLGEACRLAFTGIREKRSKQTISSFQAFCVSMGARIGVGNIAGVAVAIVSGGPGAVFWMWVFAFIGAATSFVECTIGQIYKEKKEDGLFHGGPAYYIRNGLGKPKFAAFIAILIIFTYGLMFIGVQANTATIAFSNAFGTDQLVFAVIMTVLAAVIIFGGIKRVARASVWMVPAMAMLWMILCAVIVLVNFTQVSLVIETIFSYAFGVQAFVGGGIGAAIMWGLKRGVFSNEAGIGSIPNVSSSAHVKHPVKQGLIQSVGVLIDTLVVCSATAFVVLIYTNVAYPDYANIPSSGAVLVQEAMSSTFLGAAGPYVIAIFMLVFAFSSLISYYSMSEANAKFITQRKEAIVILRVAIVAMVFVASMMSMGLAWDMADTFQALMGIFNMGVLLILSKHAFEALKDYFDQKANGVEEPIFTPESISNSKGVTCWPDTGEEDMI
ncbi:Amino-acid carrier protein AlsT [Methanocorpusculaceae archaeon Sp1]|uniref:Amino-acid carrier protein AlsT n=1 Tax=Methanorbis furvi TaxID=3028299 RepID=A0AAE4S9V9_9EURY|nr:Amino-acid carrier protein AlsT [Methanocorpusculaceae archaeon Sp1]MDV0442262.1 Amino-acid carrier protein AlsT [Methanocorpusculaceae archaeon Ag1]